MHSRNLLLALLGLGMAVVSSAQIKHTSVPLGDAIHQALEKSLLTGPNGKPFHIRISVTEPENPQSPYQGTIEEWWVSKDQWRREVTAKNGMHQTIVVSNGAHTESDQGDYFPLWLRNFVNAAFDPLPNGIESAFAASGATIDQITMPDGRKSMPCARFKVKVGHDQTAIDFFTNVCFDNEAHLQFFDFPGYGMEFHDFRPFGKTSVARELADDPESGTHLVGKVQVLEDESKADTPALFKHLPTDDNRFRSVAVSTPQLEKMIASIPPPVWPSVRSGHLEGNVSVYLSIDTHGNIREDWPLTGDNGEIHDFLRDQAVQWKVKPAVDSSGAPVQVEGSISFHFQTHIGKPLPVVTGDDIPKQLLNCTYNPKLSAGLLPKGTTFEIKVGIDQNGSEAGASFHVPPSVPWSVVAGTGLTDSHCRFKPFLEDGKPTFYSIEFIFTAP
ncbi:MAG: hypothetical protein ABSG51_09240 [Terracidiphilus sp.]|jgi:hypothetical protein